MERQIVRNRLIGRLSFVIEAGASVDEYTESAAMEPGITIGLHVNGWTLIGVQALRWDPEPDPFAVQSIGIIVANRWIGLWREIPESGE